MRTLVNIICSTTVLYICADLLYGRQYRDAILIGVAYTIHVLNVSKHRRKQCS